jgi:hypothetical protein
MSVEHLVLASCPCSPPQVSLSHDMGTGNPVYTHDAQNPCPIEQHIQHSVLPCAQTHSHYMGEGNAWYVHSGSHPCPIDCVDAPSCTPP